MLRYHPDIAGTSQHSLEMFRDVQDAYKTLSTPELKTEYDNNLAKKKAPIISDSIVPGK